MKKIGVQAGRRFVKSVSKCSFIDARRASRVEQPSAAGMSTGSTSRDQCVFMRGYKLLDRKTWLERFGRKRTRPVDGMYSYVYPRQRKDGDGGPGSRRHPTSSISLLSAMSGKSLSSGSASSSSGNYGTKRSSQGPTNRESFHSEWSLSSLEEGAEFYETAVVRGPEIHGDAGSFNHRFRKLIH